MFLLFMCINLYYLCNDRSASCQRHIHSQVGSRNKEMGLQLWQLPAAVQPAAVGQIQLPGYFVKPAYHRGQLLDLGEGPPAAPSCRPTCQQLLGQIQLLGSSVKLTGHRKESSWD
jgi:hypothetical protein